MKLRAFHILAIGAFMVTGISSCNDKYGDDLRGLGRRVEILEDSLPIKNKEIQAIQTILYTIDTNGFITGVVKNDDGTYTIKFKNDKEFTLRDGTIGKDGKDGSAADFAIGVDKGEDGVWYWVLNGQWILDDNGNRMRAGAYDGKDGKNGKNGLDDINMSLTIPMTRINPITRYWEISTDGGIKYTSTGILADGKDGKDGSAENFEISVQKGEDGIWYWTVNNKWIYDENGNRMPASAMDGKDGKDGKDDINMNLPIPKTRINPITRIWEISTDNGFTYLSTGIPADGKDGKDGTNANINIGITKVADGTYCWTLNGQMMNDTNGNPLRANGIDGKDGQNGKDGQDDINLNLPVPVVRINPVTRIWEISTDGGYTYKSTGILADGQNGTNGQDGRNGRDDSFLSVVFSTDKKYAIITLRTGRSFTVPVNAVAVPA